MSHAKSLRIFMTGVGGQGTLTATKLLAQAALSQGLPVTAGEIHGMAQRGGVVESTLSLGCASPRIGFGEADVLLGFEPIETLRALPYLRPGGAILSSDEFIAPLSVALGREKGPSLSEIKAKAAACAGSVRFLPIRTMGTQCGAVQCGNVALLGALCATGLLPFGPEVLEAAVRASMKPKAAEGNLKALALGVAACGA